MDTPEQNQPPAAGTPPPAPTDDAGRRLLRQLQGEDGYEIFADNTGPDARQRLRWEQDDSRW